MYHQRMLKNKSKQTRSDRNVIFISKHHLRNIPYISEHVNNYLYVVQIFNTIYEYK